MSPKDMKVPRIRDTEDHISEVGLRKSSTNLVPAGSILMVTRSGILSHSFPVAVTEVTVALNQDLKALTPRSDVDPTYVYWALRALERHILANCSKDGTTVASIDTDRLKRVEVSLPSRDVQQRTVSAIEELLSRLDAGATSMSSASKRLSRLRQQVLDTLVSGAAESRLLPNGWSICRLGDLLIRIDAGKSFKCEERPARIDEWGVIKVSAMTWGEFDERENKTVTTPEQINPSYEIQPGDLLLSRANTVEYVGAAVFVERCRPHLLLSDKSMRLRPADTSDPRWLRLVLGSSYVRRQIMDLATGTSDSMRNISQSKVRALRIPTPPTHQQPQIATEWSRLSSELDSAVGILTANTARAGQLRRAILAAAFTGRLPMGAGVVHSESMTELQAVGRTAE